MTRSYVKIYGPPVLSSLRALEKVALEMSKKTTMKYYSVMVPSAPYAPADASAYGNVMRDYVAGILADVEMPAEEKVKLISKSGDTLGEYDFFFEWGEEPTMQQVQELIGKIDEALADCGCRYTMTTK